MTTLMVYIADRIGNETVKNGKYLMKIAAEGIEPTTFRV